MTGADFRREFAESDTVEFKAGTGRKPIQASAVAFANVEGGIVFVGVDDRGRVLGRRHGPGTSDDLHDALRTVLGHPRYELRELDVDGQSVVAVVVWPLEEGFAQTPDGRVLVRRGTGDHALMGNDLMRFIGERAGVTSSFERRETEWSVEDADEELASALELARGWRDWRAGGLATRAGLASNRRLTVAGALLLRADHDARLGRSYVEVTRHSDDAASDYDLRREFRGAVDAQVRGVVAYVTELLGYQLAYRGAERVELPRLPERVVREVVANAVAHRDYARNGSCIQVELRPSALVVRSPGGLPPGVAVETLREAQVSRNEVLVEALRHLDLAEQRGQGIDLIEDEMQAAMLEPPRYLDLGHRFDVALLTSSTVSLEERAWVRVMTQQGRLRVGDELVLVAATRGEELSNARAQELLGVGERPARAALARLVEAGLLRREGHRSATRYWLAEEQERRLARGMSRADLRSLVAELARDHETITNADVRRAADVDRVDALRALDELVRQGALSREGERRTTRYRRVA